MADTKISNLTALAGADVAADDPLAIVDTSLTTTKKINASELKTYMSASPTLVTPTLGVATATSINKVAITAPASSATLTIANGKTLTASNTLTFTGTDGSSVAFGTGGTVLYSGEALGTPSSGTLSSCSGLSLTTGVTGVLPIAKGGTNTSTAPGTGEFIYFSGSAYTSDADLIRTANGYNANAGKGYYTEADAAGYYAVRSFAYADSTNAVFFGVTKSRGSKASKSAIVAGDDILGFRMFAYDGTSELEVAQLIFDTGPGAVSTGSIQGDIVFRIRDGASAITEVGRWDAPGNLLINGTTSPTSSVGALAVFTGTAPTATAADSVSFYSSDRTAGNTIPSFYCEGSGVTNAGITNTTVTTKIAVRVNGTIYYLLATTNAT
jgi:hypothetical protein